MRLITEGNLGSSAPVLPVRWCLSRAETEELKRERALDVHVLFVIAYEGTSLEDRSLVPVDQVMTYLNFRRPGNHIVFTAIVWGNRKAINGYFLTRTGRNTYQNDLLNEGRTDFSSSFFRRAYVIQRTTELEVSVPKEYFPKEPSERLKKIVNFQQDYMPADQCEFRRRLLFSPIRFIGLGLFVVFITLVRALVAFWLGVLCGIRKINYRAIIHPWTLDTYDVFNERGWSWFTTDSRGYERSGLYLLLSPLIYVSIFVILTVIKIANHITYFEIFRVTWQAISAFFSETWMFLAGFSLLVGICFLVAYLIRELVKKFEFKKELREEAEITKRTSNNSYDNLYKLLACRPGIVPEVSSLPVERQTTRLKFLQFKAKVCRPFAAE